MMTIDKSLFERVGGLSTLNRVHHILYTKIYLHPWLKLYFSHKPQQVLENQQTDFMMKLMGGINQYAGKTPKFAHQHMLITAELFELRHQILEETLIETNIPQELRGEWLAIDATFKRALVKESRTECNIAYSTQEILEFNQPTENDPANYFGTN